MNWMTITEYSTLKNISVSTIRRYIRHKKVESKFVDGKYFIQCDEVTEQKTTLNEHFYKNEIAMLKLRLKLLEEENNEYKMLVKLYEREKISEELPQLPM
ncbi:hypothetical protein [Bacteriovorax sp. Seq25_V]|uniref:hypothetical protein n=1 Tax=Bacteriovorax sp. Seq25_V TaxID=1201288 RepID=UPI00038A2245|nr:hypothetical protein [Bacteriovorax sp. Seq25_V]EQC43399.1 hypothetical protein M900_2814 [Bacteriovorax sp. Seq25_V]